jgi:hypothetical protein
MSGDATRDGKRHGRITAYLVDQRVPDTERGVVMLWLFAHAVAFLLLLAAETLWGAVTVARVWRRREAGWTTAIRDGVHVPTLTGLAGAHLTYAIGRRIGVARLNRRADEHAGQISG